MLFANAQIVSCVSACRKFWRVEIEALDFEILRVKPTPNNCVHLLARHISEIVVLGVCLGLRVIIGHSDDFFVFILLLQLGKKPMHRR